MTIRNRELLISTVIMTAVVMAAATTEANAATVTLNSVSGVWTSTDPGAGVSGVGTNEIRWGTPSPGSGYRFEGAPGGGTYNANEVFTAGTFTHFNELISGGVDLEAATLQVDFDVTVTNGGSASRILTSVFNFDHLETDNSGDICPDGGQNNAGVNVNGCADQVRLTTNVGASDTILVEGVPYLLALTGFAINGDPATEFWTIEEASNSAELRGVLTEQATVIPVPAALPLLLTGLASLGVLGYRRRQPA